MLINKKAKEFAFPINELSSMHDEWLSLKIKFSNGIISTIHEPTILYRQHANNVIGTKSIGSLKFYFSKLTGIKDVLFDNFRRFRLIHELNGIGFFLFLFLKLSYLYRR
jgi:hypothetical protein